MSAKELQKVFADVDKDGIGSISKEEVEIVIKKLNPNFSDAELSKVMKGLETKMVDGKLQNKDFIDYFCAPNNASNALNRELSRTVSKAEDEALLAAFKRFDTDGSGEISLKELKAIVESLGKKVSDEQVAEAYRQLDKNSDGKATFEEFKLWWTCTPGLGGHNHMILRFLKTKLAAKDGLNRVMSRVSRKKLENKDEFHLKAKSEVTATDSLTVQSTVRCTMTKKDADNEPSKITVTIGMKDESSAAKVIKANEDFNTKLKNYDEREFNEYSQVVAWGQEASKIIITITDPSGGMMMEETEPKMLYDFVQNAVSKVEASVGFGTTFNEVLAHPKRAILSCLKGFSVEADVSMRLDHWVAMMDPDNLPFATYYEPDTWTEHLVKLFGGLTIDNKLKFNEQEVRNFLATYGEEPGKILTSGIEFARDMMYEEFVNSGSIENGTWTNEISETPMLTFVKVLKELGTGGTGIESIKLEPKSGGSMLEFVLSFDNFNPFPLLKYFCGDLPNDPAKSKTSKPMAAEAATALEEAFKAFDKDGSGAIDLKELKQVTEALGGKLDDSGAEEAMRSLDKNGDGTCNFEEFQLWWCSEPGLGGYDKGALTFLKAKMSAQDMIGKFANLLSSKSGHMNTAPPQPINVTASYEVTPGMEECKSKMHFDLYLTHEDKKADGLLSAKVNFNAKSVDAASKVAEIFQKVLDFEGPGGKVSDMFNMMEIPKPECKAEGSTVTIMLQLPPEFVEQMSLNEAMDAVVPFLKCYSNSGRVKVRFANDFDDILASADKTLPELFEGAKLEYSVSVPADGRTLMLDTLRANEYRNEYYREPQGSDFWAMYNGGHLVTLFGFNKEALSSVMSSVIPEEMRSMITLDATKEILTSTATGTMPPEYMPPELKQFIPIVRDLLNSLDSLDSISIENIQKPSLADGETPTTYGAHLDLGNFKPFGLIKYYFEPILAKYEEAGMDTNNNAPPMEN